MKKVLLFMLIPFLLFSSPVGAAEKEERRLHDETIYYIMIDRFNNSDFSNNFDVELEAADKYHGGDFQGIIDRLDYIKDMGFTTVALSPVFDNKEDGYHGFWVNDYYKTEEHFGTMEKFKELVKEAHNRELKVLVDFVFNDDEDLLDVAKWWVTETNIDGYRLDSLEEIPSEVVQEMTKELKKEKEDLILLGDTRERADEASQTEIDAFFDYSLNEKLRNTFAQPDRGISPSAEGQSAIKFMDNFYTERFTRDTIKRNEHPGPRWKLALTYLYTTPGTPFVLYGSEIALDGGEAPDNVRDMDFRTDPELIEYITSIGELRKQLPLLRRGTFELLYEQDGMIVYKREYEGETAVIAINNTTKSQSAKIKSGLAEEMELRGLLNGDLVRSAGTEYEIILDRDEAEIYLLAEKTGINIPMIVATASVIVLFLGFLILVKRKARKN